MIKNINHSAFYSAHNIKLILYERPVVYICYFHFKNFRLWIILVSYFVTRSMYSSFTKVWFFGIAIKSAIPYGEQGHSITVVLKASPMIHRHETSRARLSSMKARSPRDFDDRTCERWNARMIKCEWWRWRRRRLRRRRRILPKNLSKVGLWRILFVNHDSAAFHNWKSSKWRVNEL